ncbi:MAG: PAS domain S-box protein [Gelidibacter sp.]|nr:PAS domain S-box protein [Gelidibacter sp.]
MDVSSFFKYATPAIYWLLIITWAFIFGFYILKVRAVSTKDNLLRLLLIILAIDAFRSFFESAYFGFWYTSLSGLIPKSIFNFLQQPEIVFFPKMFNLITTYIIVTILIRKWLVAEINQKKEITKLVDEQNIELIKKNKELLKAKENAEESEKNYRKLVGTMPDGVYKSTHDGKFLETNPAMVKMLGYNSKEELLEVDIKNDLYIEDADRDSIALDELNQELGIFQLRKKDGSVIWVEDHGWYSFNESGEITYHEGIMRDVTERIQKEQELIKAKEKAEESDRLKSAFLANMSHEIRTPMNGILGFSELLKTPDLSGEKQQKYLRVIERSGARMLNIINDIISISKIESGVMEVHLEAYNINEQLEYIESFFKPEAKSKGIQFLLKNGIPFNEAMIYTDREKVYAILTNLVKNAIKYTEKGTIELGYYKKDTFLQFYIKDSGIGVPKERHEAIFERFIQADISNKMAKQGAGLGLSITKAYVAMLGGQLWLESEEENLPAGKVGGSTFYFTLPYQTGIITEESFELEVSPLEVVDLTKKLKILVVDDDESSEMLISIAIQEFANEIIVARNGIEAVEACRTNPDIDLILMDIQMPEMNGYEATKQIQSLTPMCILLRKPLML